MQRERFEFNWKKLIFYVVILIIVIVMMYAFLLYRHIEQSKQAGFEAATRFILKETTLKSVNNGTYFQDELGYFIFEAENEQSEKVYVFLLDNDKFIESDITIVSFSDIVTPNKMEETFLNECGNCSLIKTTPAMIDDTPLMEFVYTDLADQYNIEYKYLSDGTTYEKLRLTNKYKKG